MARKQTDTTENDEKNRRRIFELAIKLWKDGARLHRVRESLGAKIEEWASRANINVDDLRAYEREGEIRGNFWMFCIHLQSFIDPRLLDDPDRLEGLLGPDQSDKLRGGRITRRDKWYGYGGKKHEKFRRWAHRKYIEKLSDHEREKQRSREELDRLHREWENAGRPDAEEYLEP